MIEMRSQSLAAAVEAYPLASDHELPRGVVLAGHSAALLDHCERNGTLGLLRYAVQRGALRIGPPARRELEARLRSVYAGDLGVERTLLTVVDELGVAGIECRVLGGCALAQTTYPCPEMRVLDGVHVLVAREHLDRASALSREMAGDLVVHSLPFEVSDVFAAPYRFPLAGYELAALPMPHRLLQLCAFPAEASSTSPVVHSRDIAELITRESPNLVDVLLLARAWDCEQGLASAVVEAWNALALTGHSPLVTWARRATGQGDLDRSRP